jgi:hypothetical protein
LIEHTSHLRNQAHHQVMTLVGVAAYYISAPTTISNFAQPVTRHARRKLKPLITPTLAVMCAAERVHSAMPHRVHH